MVVKPIFPLRMPQARQPKLEISTRHFFVSTSQIAYDLGIISNLQYRLSGHPTPSPCCEEELASLFLDVRTA